MNSRKNKRREDAAGGSAAVVSPARRSFAAASVQSIPVALSPELVNRRERKERRDAKPQPRSAAVSAAACRQCKYPGTIPDSVSGEAAAGGTPALRHLLAAREQVGLLQSERRGLANTENLIVRGMSVRGIKRLEGRGMIGRGIEAARIPIPLTTIPLTKPSSSSLSAFFAFFRSQNQNRDVNSHENGSLALFPCRSFPCHCSSKPASLLPRRNAKDAKGRSCFNAEARRSLRVAEKTGWSPQRSSAFSAPPNTVLNPIPTPFVLPILVKTADTPETHAIGRA